MHSQHEHLCWIQRFIEVRAAGVTVQVNAESHNTHTNATMAPTIGTNEIWGVAEKEREKESKRMKRERDVL